MAMAQAVMRNTWSLLSEKMHIHGWHTHCSLCSPLPRTHMGALTPRFPPGTPECKNTSEPPASIITRNKGTPSEATAPPFSLWRLKARVCVHTGCVCTQSGCPVQCTRLWDNLCHEMRTPSHQHLTWGVWDMQGLPCLTKQNTQSELACAICSLTLRNSLKCYLFLVWFLKTPKTWHRLWRTWLCQQVPNFKHRFAFNFILVRGNANLSEFRVKTHLILKVFLHLNCTTWTSKKEMSRN